MKLIKALGAALLLAGTLMFSACNQDRYEHFHSLEFDTEGIELQKNGNGIYEAEVPASEFTFRITGKGKYKDVTYVTKIIVDDVCQERPCDFEKDEPPYLEVYPVYAGEWGNIDFETRTSPYKMLFHLTANENKKQRVYVFDLGYGYWHDTIRIIQKGTE